MHQEFPRHLFIRVYPPRLIAFFSVKIFCPMQPAKRMGFSKTGTNRMETITSRLENRDATRPQCFLLVYSGTWVSERKSLGEDFFIRPIIAFRVLFLFTSGGVTFVCPVNWIIVAVFRPLVVNYNNYNYLNYSSYKFLALHEELFPIKSYVKENAILELYFFLVGKLKPSRQ